MYVFLNKITEVNSFLSELHLTNKGLINSKNNELLFEVENYSEIFDFGINHLIIKDIRGNSIILNKNNYEKDTKFKIDSQNYPFLAFYEFEGVDIEGVFDYLTKTILFETTEWIGRDILGENIFAEYNSKIVCRSVYSAEPLWQFDLVSFGEYVNYKGESKPYKVEKFIGEWESELLVGCSNGLVLSVDIETGIEKRRWQALDNYYPKVKEVANKLPRTENFVLDKSTHTIVALHIFSMVIIDLQTGEIIVADMEDELRTHNVNLLKNNSLYAMDSTHIYTTATMDYTGNKYQWTYDCLLAINRTTYKVDWQYRFEDEGLGTHTPQISENKLYQLTSSNNLYIFEKA